MSKIDLDPITSGYNLSKINANFQKVEDELNNKVLYRDPPAGEPNSMSSNLDMNSRSILNANKISSNVLELGGVQVVPTNLAIDTYNGTREALRRSYAEAGYNLVAGSFEAGGMLVNSSDVLLHEASGKAFSGPAGTVAAGTDPNSGGFVDRSGVFNQRMVWASLVGILPTNTPSQNTAALNAARAVGGVSLYFPAGAYPFDVFPTTGLTEVSGAGKDTVTIELHGTTSPVMVQPGPIVHKGIWFKSVAGSLEWSRVGMSNYAVFDKCKITGFTHTSMLPNAWGIYLDKVTGCRLYYCELDGNSQSDIAIVEGVTDFMAVGCYSANGTLNINIETNVNTPAIGGIVLQGMNIKTLQLLCNALSGDSPDKAVTVLGCSVNTLIYDGIGASFIESKIKNYEMQLDNLNRAYGANITGIRVAARELLPDPMLSSVGDTGNWKIQFSSATPANRYNRGVENQLVIGVNGVAAQTIVTSGNIPCAPETPYLVTIAKGYIQYAGRNDIISVQFKNSSGVLIGSAISLVKAGAQFLPDTQQHIVVSPTNAAFIELWLSGSDSTVDYQSTQYSYASVRQILASGVGVDSSSIGYSQFPKRVPVGDTAVNFFSFNHYFCPLPVGTEVEFAYAAGGTRLSQVTAAATGATVNLGTLRVIANYP